MINPYDFYITPEEYKRASENGIKKGTLENRIRKLGWDKERAINTPCQKRSNYSKWYKIAAKNGINKSTFSSRVNKGNWSAEKAATTPIMNRMEICRKYPAEVYKTLEENGISLSTFRKRIKRGWTIERATTEKINSNQEALRKMWDKSKNVNTGFKETHKSYWNLRSNNKINI